MRRSNRSAWRRPSGLQLVIIVVVGLTIVSLTLAGVTLVMRFSAAGAADVAQGTASSAPEPPGITVSATPAPAPTAPLVAIAQAAPDERATRTAARASATAQAHERLQLATSAALSAAATVMAPQAPTIQAGQAEATARYAPEIDRLLLDNGYYANIIRVGDLRGLRASQRNYSNSVWTRDLDYAISGYSYALGDMALFAENIELFLRYVTPDGVAPETIYLRGGRLDWENRMSWDSMPNLIHAVYVYVAKTGDHAFYMQHRDQLLCMGDWIARLDTTGDGLPDQDIFPYGYYDSIINGPLHTYALAKFYAAYQELAELEALIGQPDTLWRQRAFQLRSGFHRPLAEGGYWLDDQPWPIAWKHADGRVVKVLETFGVFAALRSGLIAPRDERYPALVAALHSSLPALLDEPTPFKLTLGGYEPEVRRVVDPPVPLWMLDASAPWIVGLAAPAYAAAGYPEDAQTIMAAYTRMVLATNPPVIEFAAGPNARFGPGNSNDRGRTWDSAAWFMAIYGGHYGLTMTPGALIVEPRPYQDLPADEVIGLSYQGARVTLSLARSEATYRIQTDRPIVAILRPMSSGKQVRVDGGPLRIEVSQLLEPGRIYVITSE